MPRCPSPTTSLGQLKPRRLMSLSTSDQCSVDSLYPGTALTTTLLPSLRAAITTSTAAFSFSRPALTYGSIHPHVDHLQVIEGPAAPLGKLIVPLGLQPGHRARRYRCPSSEPAVPAKPDRSRLRIDRAGTAEGSTPTFLVLLTNSGSSRLSNCSRYRGLAAASAVSFPDSA